MATVLVLALLTQSGGAGAATFDSLDASTAVAGSSVVLRDFYESNVNAQQKLKDHLIKPTEEPTTEAPTEPETPAEPVTQAPVRATASPITEPAVQVDISDLVDYEYVRMGLVSAPGYLNVRNDSSVTAEVIGQAVRGEELALVGEIRVGNTYWFRVRRQNSYGYVSGDYVVFGAQAEALKQQIAAEIAAQAAAADPLAVAESFELPDGISHLSASAQEEVKTAVRNLNYVLKHDYPAAKEAEDYTHMYSILVYLLELYQRVSNVAGKYGLSATVRAAND
ncbi:MAG: SH3 domain-containing protein, partial [Lachnospiraceae bacterium]|nr:SH3 domain-containing protein [Lachnospiraceae bacterium]